MNRHDTPTAAAEPVPHPLALRLSELLRGSAERVLLVGIGSGRNVAPLLAAGLRVDAVEDDAERAFAAERRFALEPRVCVVRASYGAPFPARTYAGALSTHALLHGTPAGIGLTIAEVRERLSTDAPFFTTLGSRRDPRYGIGRQIAAGTFAQADGSEANVPHAYFDERGVRELFEGFALEALCQESAAETAGRWAHGASEAATLVHWFVRARRR